MKEKDEITQLFRNRLADAKMAVRKDVWEDLQKDLVQVPLQKRLFFSPWIYRTCAVASVVLVLGGALAAFWFFSPNEEIQDAFIRMAVMTPEESMNREVAQEFLPVDYHLDKSVDRETRNKCLESKVREELTTAVEEEAITLHVSIRVTQQFYGNNRQIGEKFYGSADGRYRSGMVAVSTEPEPVKAVEEDSVVIGGKKSIFSGRAIKVAVGSSLPGNGEKVPFTVGVSMERRLNRHLSLETGLQYHILSAECAFHLLSVPVRLNAVLMSLPKVDLYAMAGGNVEKCVGGALDNSFRAEPVQMSVMAGVGVRYKMNDRFALFMEPSVAHYFGADSQSGALRTEYPANLNLMCGIRMTY